MIVIRKETSIVQSLIFDHIWQTSALFILFSVHVFAMLCLEWKITFEYFILFLYALYLQDWIVRHAWVGNYDYGIQQVQMPLLVLRCLQIWLRCSLMCWLILAHQQNMDVNFIIQPFCYRLEEAAYVPPLEYYIPVFRGDRRLKCNDIFIQISFQIWIISQICFSCKERRGNSLYHMFGSFW